MNIHPLLVSVPIGLLAAYSVVELAAHFFPKLRDARWVFPLTTFLLLVGIIAAITALITGGVAEDLAKDSNLYTSIIKVHAPVAGVTTLIYLLLAAAHIVRLFDRRGWGNSFAGINRPFMRIWNYKKYVAHLVLDTWLLPVLAFAGLIGVLLTGILGTAIVYGPNADVFVSFVCHVLGVQ